jgi:hypothetical protein
MNRQIEKMLAAEKDPRRVVRRGGIDLPWTSPVFAVAFALGKLTRVVRFDGRGIRLVGKNSSHVKEEIMETASYLIRACELLERETERDRMGSRRDRAGQA